VRMGQLPSNRSWLVTGASSSSDSSFIGSRVYTRHGAAARPWEEAR
jgi:hypothetical protein